MRHMGLPTVMKNDSLSSIVLMSWERETGTAPSKSLFVERVRFWTEPANNESSLYGDSEELLGKWFKRTGKRDDIFLASKFGFIKGGRFEIDSSYDYCKKACAESLRLLGIDTIDLCRYTDPKKAAPLAMNEGQPIPWKAYPTSRRLLTAC